MHYWSSFTPKCTTRKQSRAMGKISKIAKYVYKGILNIIKRKFIKKKSSI